MSITVNNEIEKTVAVLSALANSRQVIANVEALAQQVTKALRAGNKVLLAGNGGSAADAQHIAGEFVSRFNFDRPGLAAFALTVDTSVMTAIGNDYGYEKLFARQIEAVGRPGDIFWAYSTSGRSPNILRALEVANERGLFRVGFTGNHPEGVAEMRARTDLCIEIPSTSTPKIQEGHLVCGHIVCGIVEENIFAS
ncbi:D-sedoheptulose-7-phosphate isomerase [Paraburkholderia phytofirmans]|uniref:Phosphoheptose isomerase n=1 Tax=Paraburkholderia phytofirmans OLGA172 TaxID=1417228 RepID=A0A160FHA5_9BURK|nr:D-sedoheptulose 7-phosphate isomerase [Paraburkholderia phytofirmans]ANB71519.1 phosphoheptose isomerase [Paraburkholderia phytofirmans OLGA172]